MRRHALIALLLAFAFACLAAPAPIVPQPAAMPPGSGLSARWEGAFSRSQGWTGGDVARSVPLPDGRVLWLFGDSWVGKIEHGRHAAGSTMVPNAVAVSEDATGRGRIEFRFGSETSTPTAWVRPSAKVERRWRSNEHTLVYWPTGDARVHNDKLTMFVDAVAKRRGGGTWDFESQGTVLLEIPNWPDPVETWRPSQTIVPWSGTQADGSTIHWGIAIAPLNSEMIVYGRRSSGTASSLVAARAATLSNFDAWRFLSGGTWKNEPVALDRLADGISMEPTVHSIDGLGWVLLESAPRLSPKVHVRFAQAPLGPWSCAIELFEISAVRGEPGLFAAQAKLHPHLGDSEHLLVSWVVNAHDFWDMAKNADLYRPRFRSVTFDQLERARQRSRACPQRPSHRPE